MRMGVYAIWDSKAEAMMQPLFMVNDAVAQRNFVNACLSDQTPMFSNAGDFTLFKVAEWDDIEGRFYEELRIDLGNGLGLMAQYADELGKVQRLREKIEELQTVPGNLGANGDRLDA